MNKITLTISIIGLTTLVSCNRTDFSNPEEVIKNYRILALANKNEILYDDFLSTKSKEFVTKDEYIKDRNIPDSIVKSSRHLERKISTFPVDINNPSLRRFKVTEKGLLKTDTIYANIYYTLSNENGEWKIIWTKTLLSFAREKFNGGIYSEARKSLEKIIEIDPYNGENYSLLAWCYYRDKSLSSDEWESGFVKNAKYAVTLEEAEPSHYNTLGAYYSSIGNSDLAIENCQRGLKFCLNKDDKQMFYSNLALEYTGLMKYDKAEEYINKSIKINSKDPFIWLTYGNLMKRQQKYTKAIEYYKKALSKPKMDNSLQGSLFYSYAFCCKQTGNCTDAKEYINKALDIEPSNDSYQSLYRNIRNCK